MGFWTRVFGSGGEIRKDGYQYPWPSTKRTSNVTFDKAMSVSAYWASARLLTEAVAAMPLQSFLLDQSDEIKVVDKNYRLWQKLNYKPNQYQTRTEFFESIMLNLVTWGNAYCTVQRNSQGEVISLIPLQSAQMQVRLDDGDIVYEYTDADSNKQFLSQKTVWHIKLFGNGVIGLSPMGYAAQALGIAIDTGDRVQKLAASGGKATGILTIDQALTPTQKENIKKSFSNMTEGDGEGLYVLEAGFKYNQISLSPADVQLIENRRFQIEDIARFMGVPSVLINDTSATTTWGSGIQQITEGFYKLNLRPYLERIESSIKRHLMPESEWMTRDIEFNFDALLRANRSERLDAQSKAVNSGILAPNEARKEEGLPPQNGGEYIYLNGSLVRADSEVSNDNTA